MLVALRPCYPSLSTLTLVELILDFLIQHVFVYADSVFSFFSNFLSPTVVGLVSTAFTVATDFPLYTISARCVHYEYTLSTVGSLRPAISAKSLTSLISDLYSFRFSLSSLADFSCSPVSAIIFADSRLLSITPMR